ncbi:MAG: hypothetical protein PHT92_13000 [Bacteroidales bacterium]|nr:hypothetical protein [Bacteroidales bacterium]
MFRKTTLTLIVISCALICSASNYRKFDSNVSNLASANLSLRDTVAYDKLLLANGKEMLVAVQRVSDRFVFFIKPNGSSTDWIDRNEVKAIHYKSGEVDKLDKPPANAEPAKPKDWQSIELTRKPNDIEGLTKVDDIEIRLISPSNRNYQSAKALERSAEVSIMKQAASMNADIVLITKVNHIRAYGDPPVIIMTAEAYKKR